MKNSKFLRENIYLPSMRFLYRKSIFKNVFDQNFFICLPIFNIIAAHFATNYMLRCAKKIQSVLSVLEVLYFKNFQLSFFNS